MIDVAEMIGSLYEPARNASKNAYSPYSGASVGAAVLDGEGNIHTGCNV